MLVKRKIGSVGRMNENPEMVKIGVPVLMLAIFDLICFLMDFVLIPLRTKNFHVPSDTDCWVIKTNRKHLVQTNMLLSEVTSEWPCISLYTASVWFIICINYVTHTQKEKSHFSSHCIYFQVMVNLLHLDYLKRVLRTERKLSTTTAERAVLDSDSRAQIDRILFLCNNIQEFQMMDIYEK